MNRDLRKTNKLSHVISKQNAYANKYDRAIITNKTKLDQFKMRAHSLARTSLSRRLDRLRPPPLDLVSSLQPFNPIVIGAMNTSTFRFLNTQSSSLPSQSLFPLLLLPPPPPSPSPLLPSSSQEQNSVANFVQESKNKMKEDDSNHKLLYGNWSPFSPMIATSDECQQQENISPPDPATSLPWSMDYPSSPSSPTMLFNPTFVSSPTTGLMKKMI